MPIIEELLRSEPNGSISFGNYKLGKKSKMDNFEHQGDLYKVKTFYEITKLERNGMFVYESVPGTAVTEFKAADWGVEFLVESDKDAQITVQLEDDTEYTVHVDGVSVGGMTTNMSGKLNVSVELSEGTPAQVRIEKRK
ncbi:MAG: endosialidase [Hungatella sp.]|nr:endosialidase [Hungatella sp.]